jgi:hypothetical protein
VDTVAIEALAALFRGLPAAPWVVLVLFVGWVIHSDRRTRHLAELIRAARPTGRNETAVVARREAGEAPDE